MKDTSSNYVLSVITTFMAALQSDAIRAWITFGLGTISFILSIIISFIKLKRTIKESDGDIDKIVDAIEDTVEDVQDKVEEFKGDINGKR